MGRRIKDFVEIADHASLDTLIEQLIEVRDSLPADAEPEVRLRGDEVFGRRLSICYLREQTEEEQACEARYSDAAKEARERELARLQEELGVVCYAPSGRRKLRIVA